MLSCDVSVSDPYRKRLTALCLRTIFNCVSKGLSKSLNMYWTLCIHRGGHERVNHAAVAIGYCIYSFGGFCTDNMPQYIDAYCFNTISLKWSKVDYETTSQSPRACYGHSVVAFNGLIYLWGGQSFTLASNTLYCFNTETLSWSIPETSGKWPKVTDGHSACVIGDYMYIFGGYEEDTRSFSDKVFRINLITFNWETVLTHLSFAVYFFVHWGFDNTQEILKYRIAWLRLSYQPTFQMVSAFRKFMFTLISGATLDLMATSPAEICSQQLLRRQFITSTSGNGIIRFYIMVYKDEIYIIGGFDGVTLKHLNDVFKYNPVNSEWTEFKVNGEPPCPRKRHCAVVVKDNIYLFGGSSPAHNDAVEENESLLDMQEHSDLYVLEFFPTLKRLSVLNIIDNRIDTDGLPTILKGEIEWLKSQPRRAFGRRNYSAFSPPLYFS
ncbi:kelch domain-containing protein 3 [Nephila pilipes]|uniref:Kelch domain-containing protein 3 n=1 Tax=Nephila pilipes TaxID=299642 RepID=A0A8X6PNG3_NEPPI|nr:kelch domain-containing protein 3 [Nephila pilipes]